MSTSNIRGSSLSKTFIKYGLLGWVLRRSKCTAHILSEFRVQEGKWCRLYTGDVNTPNKGFLSISSGGKAEVDTGT